MILKSQLSIEAHARSCHGVYLRAAQREHRRAHDPRRVARSRRDVRGAFASICAAVTVCDVDALMMLEVPLLEWSSERRGASRIAYPRLSGP